MVTNPTQIGIRFLGGFVAIALLTWFASINDDTGNIAVAIIAVLWLLWIMQTTVVNGKAQMPNANAIAILASKL